MATRVSGPAKAPAGDRRWHAVSVKPGTSPCPVAVSGRSRRWLSREAPLLPLPGCTRPDVCTCTYYHHDDRRHGARRAEDTGAFRMPSQPTTERRSRKDRRAQPDE